MCYWAKISAGSDVIKNCGNAAKKEDREITYNEKAKYGIKKRQPLTFVKC